MVDVAIVIVSAVLARALYSGYQAVATDDVGLGALVALIFFLYSRNQGLYRLDATVRPLSHLKAVIAALSLSTVTVVLVFFFLKTGSDHSRAVVALFYLIATVGICAGRLIFGRWLARAVEAGLLCGGPAIVLGDAAECRAIRPQEWLDFGIDAVARFELHGGGPGLNDTDLQTVDAALEAARLLRGAEIALFVSWTRETALGEILSLARSAPLPVRLYPDRRTRELLRQHRGSRFAPHLAVELQREPLRKGERLIKRAFDIVISLAALAFLSPVLVLAAIFIKLESPGPVIFRQRRMGFDNRAFTIFKFRTMTVWEDGESIRQVSKGDSRVTRFGDLLRRTSVDELPQLVNVLRGEMSLVGPRPHAIAHDQEYSAQIAEYARRNHVKPGLTGAAQVRGLRGETRTLQQMRDRVKWDLWYIGSWSFTLDLQIIIQTFISLARYEAY